MCDTSATLLERVRDKADPEAWPRFVKLYAPLLFAWCRRMGLQEADAADLVQEVLALLLQKLPFFVYDPKRSFRAWLRTVAVNHWRASQRRRTVCTAGAEALDGVAAPEEEAFWEDEYRKHLVSRALAVMKTEFQPTTWEACWECVVNGRRPEEVAARLHVSAGAVRAAKFRVLSRLRAELGGLLE
jgi:RNA polymerase sigma-70 factor (ECF subfamily)